MKSLIVGLLIIAFAVFSVLPVKPDGFGLGWWTNVIDFLKGAVPVIAGLIGIIVIFIGIADIKDRAEAKKQNTKNN